MIPSPDSPAPSRENRCASQFRYSGRRNRKKTEDYASEASEGAEVQRQEANREAEAMTSEAMPTTAEGWFQRRLDQKRRETVQDEKGKIRSLLARTDRISKSATRVAIALLDSGRSYEEIYESASRASPDATESVHRSVMRREASLMERQEPEAEEDWLRQAREAAEKAWLALHPERKSEAAKLRSMKPSEVAFTRMVSSLAQTAAGLDYYEGEKRHRGDHVDAELRQRGEQAARRLWPGR
jgi:hypothetical protein